MAGRKRGCNRSERVSRWTDLDLTLVEVISHQRGENCRSELLLGQVCQVVAQSHIGAFYMLFELHWCIRLPKLISMVNVILMKAKPPVSLTACTHLGYGFIQLLMRSEKCVGICQLSQHVQNCSGLAITCFGNYCLL